jgi:two-component system response regulator YesN
MNLMIVEDEIRILNSLANSIPWDKHDIEVVALAENGKEALAIMERRKPDIVLLDIEMPEMDGLSLAEIILEREPQTKIIILSGHDTFQYAQRAIGLGVMKYLLKPAGDEEIMQSVLEAAEEIRRELMEKISITELQQMWRSRLPQLQEEFLRNWMMNRYALWELHKHSRELNMELTGEERFAVSVCEIDPLTEEETRFSASDTPLLQFSLECIAKEFVQKEECRVFNDANGLTVVVFLGRPGESDADLTKRHNVHISRLLNVVKECLKLTASAGLGTVCSLEEVPQSYQQACRALQERAIYGHDIAIPYWEVKQSASEVQFESSFKKQLEIAIYTNETERMFSLIEEYVNNAFVQAGSSEFVYEHVLHLSSVFTQIIQAQGWPMHRVLGDEYTQFLSLESLGSKSQILEWARRVVGYITAYDENERKSSSHQTIKKIWETVDQMLAEDLSLHSLAERLYVNSSYLSRLFKKETGESFSSYVMTRRMERAKELLQGDAKVYDAANAVGYRDISYFAKVFRKYWGVAPSEIRK